MGHFHSMGRCSDASMEDSPRLNRPTVRFSSSSPAPSKWCSTVPLHPQNISASPRARIATPCFTPCTSALGPSTMRTERISYKGHPAHLAGEGAVSIDPILPPTCMAPPRWRSNSSWESRCCRQDETNRTVVMKSVYSRLFACPKKRGFENALEGFSFHKRCPLCTTCARRLDGGLLAVLHVEPEPRLRIEDWTFTVRGVGRDDSSPDRKDVLARTHSAT